MTLIPLTIEGKHIGPAERCLLIAGVSANHDRDLDQGHVPTDAGFRFVRPGAGIPPDDHPLSRTARPGDLVTRDDCCRT